MSIEHILTNYWDNLHTCQTIEDFSLLLTWLDQECTEYLCTLETENNSSLAFINIADSFPILPLAAEVYLLCPTAVHLVAERNLTYKFALTELMKLSQEEIVSMRISISPIRVKKDKKQSKLISLAEKRLAKIT